ncbi:MFS transporter [Streptomyces spirodelae]|uniref:MFS transporter n=1 Tax=Streptomyces spirodelae TaxID=2812904 RepID=A0ABS3X0D5_9ACTN|nr:MFS transporter [Streptomyces spirodelae]MBO8188778.1 MFS transporter [Streptomyces spirodelae]
MSAHGRGILLVLCGAVFLEGIDIGMLNVALPVIRADLGMPVGELQWVMSSYVLGYGGFMLLGGRAADLYGRRRMFVLSLAVFLAFSGLAGLASAGWALIVARFVTGVAAAFMTPAGLSLITTSFTEGRQRNKALLIYSGTGAAGFSTGLVFGGLLTVLGWRWVFFAPVALSALILTATLVLIPRGPRSGQDREAGQCRSFDLAGGVTITAALVLLVFGIERATHSSWPQTLAVLAAGAILLCVFIQIERRTAAPLIRPRMLRSGPLVRANAVALLFAGAFFGFQFLVVLYLQELRDWSTLETSLAMLVAGADAVLSPTVVPRLVNRFGSARVVFSGVLAAVLAYALFVPVGADWSYLAMLPSLTLVGVAFALAYGPLTIMATDGVAEEEQGVAGALLFASVQFGAALGLAGAAAVNTAATEADTPAALLDGYQAGFLVPLAAALIAATVAAFGVRGRRGRRAERAVAQQRVAESGPGPTEPADPAILTER